MKRDSGAQAAGEVGLGFPEVGASGAQETGGWRREARLMKTGS